MVLVGFSLQMPLESGFPVLCHYRIAFLYFNVFSCLWIIKAFEITLFYFLYLVIFRLFEGRSSRKPEKLKTLFCYFRRVTEKSKFLSFLIHILSLIQMVQIKWQVRNILCSNYTFLPKPNNSVLSSRFYACYIH